MVHSVDGKGRGMTGGSHGYPRYVGWVQTHVPSSTAYNEYSLAQPLLLCVGCTVILKGSHRCVVLGTHACTQSPVLAFAATLTSLPPQGPTKLSGVVILRPPPQGIPSLPLLLSSPSLEGGGTNSTASQPGGGDFLGRCSNFQLCNSGGHRTPPPMSWRLSWAGGGGGVPQTALDSGQSP